MTFPRASEALSRCLIYARSPGVDLRAARHWEKTKSSDGKTNELSLQYGKFSTACPYAIVC